jgi:hypothetical protein
MITWSEWQDLNLRPLRPERSCRQADSNVFSGLVLPAVRWNAPMLRRIVGKTLVMQISVDIQRIEF